MASKKTATKTAPSSVNPLRVGNDVFIRTVTGYYTGKIVAIEGGDILLDQAAWIADTGRFSQAVASGQFSEVEPYPDGTIVAVSRASYVDASVLRGPLPRTQK
jgi:O-acetylhomoserine/O-acetylserine sulfhydrylase-like pyridoxal-dependent enzyme